MTTIATVQQVKDYLRIETSAEDSLLSYLLTRAQAEIEAQCGRSLTTEEIVWYDDATTFRIGTGAVSNLLLGYPMVDATTVVVKDKDGVTIDAANYTVRKDRGLICASNVGTIATVYVFDNGPYTIACTAGYGTEANYATRWVPMIQTLLIDWVGYLYWQRTSGAMHEGSAGVSVDYAIDAAWGIPARLVRGIRKLRGPVFAR